MNINYSILADAIDYYQRLGYKYLEMDWYVAEEALRKTLPKDRRIWKYDSGFLVGSGEQSFIEALMYTDRLEPDAKYCCCTPCFREEPEYDEYHLPCFMKVELIYTGVKAIEEKDLFLAGVYEDAKSFFQRYLKHVYEVGTDIGWDLCAKVDGKMIELGSYGVRTFKAGDRTIEFVYGTGCAEPRLSQCLPAPGYHMCPIPKEPWGSSRKLLEEVREYLDAIDQNTTIMAGVELSDLYGALLHEAKKLNLTLYDLYLMSQATSRAFENGRRTT
jgi:hypothetical protein